MIIIFLFSIADEPKDSLHEFRVSIDLIHSIFSVRLSMLFLSLRHVHRIRADQLGGADLSSYSRHIVRGYEIDSLILLRWSFLHSFCCMEFFIRLFRVFFYDLELNDS